MGMKFHLNVPENNDFINAKVFSWLLTLAIEREAMRENVHYSELQQQNIQIIFQLSFHDLVGNKNSNIYNFISFD